MRSIKQFFQDNAGTAEATSAVILIAAVGVCLAFGLVAWYGGLTTAFTTAGNRFGTVTGSMVSGF